MHRPPGTHQPRKRRQLDWELIACGFSGHHLVGTDAAELREEDGLFAREQPPIRWHRCLRCDSWLPLEPPEQPTPSTRRTATRSRCRSAARRCATRWCFA